MRPNLSLIGPVAALLAFAATAPGALVVHLTYDADYTNQGTSGAVNHGAPVGGTVFIVSGGLKIGNGALFVGGTGNWANHGEVGASPVTGSAVRTTSVWIQAQPNQNFLQTPFAFGVNGTGSKWDFDLDASNGFEIGVGAGRSIVTGIPVNDGNWHLLTAVVPNTGLNVQGIRLYIDGVLIPQSTTSTTAINTAADNFFVGRSVNNGAAGTPTQGFNGFVDDIAVWDVAFSANEVKGFFDMGDSAMFAYNAAQFDALKAVHDAGGGSVVIGGTTWSYATGLGSGAGLNGSDLVLNAAAGTGLRATPIPEPTTGLLAFLGLASVGFRRRR